MARKAHSQSPHTYVLHAFTRATEIAVTIVPQSMGTLESPINPAKERRFVSGMSSLLAWACTEADIEYEYEGEVSAGPWLYLYKLSQWGNPICRDEY